MKWNQNSQYQPDSATPRSYHDFTLIELPMMIAITPSWPACSNSMWVQFFANQDKPNAMKKNYLSTTMTALMLSLASLTLPPISDLHAAEIFTKVTTGPKHDAGYSLGAAWGDYDGDGFIDLFVANTGPGGSGSASHLLYQNNANGTFSRVTNGPVAAVFSAGSGGAWGDYDNDGYLDLVLVNFAQPNYLFHNDGDGSFAEVPNAAPVLISPTPGA